jgi:RNA polymerase sigma-70 factor (ECF subfamily)
LLAGRAFTKYFFAPSLRLCAFAVNGISVIFFPYLRPIHKVSILAIEEEKKFIDLINGNQGLIHKVCIMYENDPDARNDLFQEIVLQLWRSFPSFRGEAKITTWMYRIALNTAISGFRKQTRYVKTEDLQEAHFNISDYSGDEREEDSQRLQWAIRQLTEIERAMIMMALEEVPYDEIAETIGITQNNVRVRMNRIREKLRKLME